MLESKRSPENMKYLAGASLCLIISAPAAIAAGCENWNSVEFFETATVEEVSYCFGG